MVCVLMTLFACCCFYACLRDEGANANISKEGRFFNALGADVLLQRITAKLEQKNDSSGFMTLFVARYGYPLWADACKFRENGHTVFAVPVRSIVPYAEINAIWFFTVFSDHTRYRIYTRAMAERLWQRVGGDGVEETWMFDYFTHRVLHRQPRSNLRFEEVCESPSVRSSGGGVEWHCVHAYAGYEGAEGDLGVHCWTTPVEEEDEDGDIPWDGEGADGDLDTGDHGDGDENGGGDGPPNPQPNDPVQVAPKATSIFRNSNMTKQNWKIIENMLDKIMLDCLGEELYKGLKSLLNGKKLTIQFKESMNGSFSFQGESAGIALGMQMESNQLLHEMFHAYQAYQNTFEQYKDAMLNLEIEAHYAQYLYTSRLDEYKGSKWEKRDIYDIRRKSIKKLAKYIDEKGNLLPGVTNDLLDLEITSCVIPALHTAGYTASKYPLNDNINGVANFKNLNKLTVNCD